MNRSEPPKTLAKIFLFSKLRLDKRLAMCLVALLLTLPAMFAHAADSLLGAGDVIRVTVFGSPELSLETRVTDSGKISYPLIGEVSIGGLSASDAEKKIAGLLEAGSFVKKPQVNIQTVSLQSQQISVLGYVAHPGRYPVEGKRTLLDVLALAGGATLEGADNAILVQTRDGKTTRTEINIGQMITSADLQQNVLLVGGDVVYVERAPRFFIYGEVQKPGTFRLDSKLTVGQALAIAGGLNPRGTERGITLKRRDAQGALQTLKVRFDDSVEPDDVIFIRESLF